MLSSKNWIFIDLFFFFALKLTFTPSKTLFWILKIVENSLNTYITFYNFRIHFFVILGSINRNLNSAGYFSFESYEKYAHELFDLGAIINDIALIKSPLTIAFTGLFQKLNILPLQ